MSLSSPPCWYCDRVGYRATTSKHALDFQNCRKIACEEPDSTGTLFLQYNFFNMAYCLDRITAICNIQFFDKCYGFRPHHLEWLISPRFIACHPVPSSKYEKYMYCTPKVETTPGHATLVVGIVNWYPIWQSISKGEGSWVVRLKWTAMPWSFSFARPHAQIP